MEQLNVFVAALRDEVAGLPDATLNHRPSADEWSILDVAGHLCDASRYLHERLAKIIWLEEPRLPAYDEQEELAKRRAAPRPIEALLEEFAAKRAETVEMLSDLVHWNWSRTGRHEEFGKMSVRQFVDRAIAHDALHLEQIRALKRAA